MKQHIREVSIEFDRFRWEMTQTRLLVPLQDTVTHRNTLRNTVTQLSDRVTYTVFFKGLIVMLTWDWIYLNKYWQWYFILLLCCQTTSNFRTEPQNTIDFSWRFYIPALQTSKLRHRTIKRFAQVYTSNHFCYTEHQPPADPSHSTISQQNSRGNIRGRSLGEIQIFTPLCTSSQAPPEAPLSTSSSLWPLPILL